MKKIVMAILLMFSVTAGYTQAIYYWVGGASSASINAGANWNTSLDGSGSSRPSSSGSSDILVFDGTNLGGAAVVTGPIVVNANAGITAAQLKFVNNASVSFVRNSSGTTTINLSGGPGEDFVIEAGAKFSITSTTGSIVIAMVAANTGRVSGDFAMITTLQARIANTTSGTRGSLVFTSGATFTSNITAASAAYPFGNSSQSSEQWVVFEAGSHLYYNGGYSPHGSGTLFSAIDMQPGSTWHHRATNTASGNFFNRKNFGDVIVENNATLHAQGTIYSIGNLTVNAGSTFNTHTSGETVVLGNLTVNGDLLSETGSSHVLVLGGSTTQTVSGSGRINVGALVIGDNAEVVLHKNMAVENGFTNYGHVHFNQSQVTGGGAFFARAHTTAPALTGNLVVGREIISAVAGFNDDYIGLTVTGEGIAPNTTVVSRSGTLDSIYLSKPVLSTATGVTLTFSSGESTLQTAHVNGFDATSGSVTVSGNHIYSNGIHYVVDAATVVPFGVSTGSADTHIVAGNVVLNAPVTTNTGVWVSGQLQLNNGNATIRPADTVRILNGGSVSGNFSASNYFITDVNYATGAQGVLRIDGKNGLILLPVGTSLHYLPATINTPVSADFTVAVFQGITNEGTPDGTPLTPLQKQIKVDAVWNINRLSGTGSTDLQLSWVPALEGSTFVTLDNAEIGLIKNENPGWSLPLAVGDNINNLASAAITTFGAFSIGSLPPTDPFIFNPLPEKIYGDADFNAGVISLNTTTPIVYTSSNPAVAMIVGTDIRITGTGTTTITATQATDGFYPAANVSHMLVVQKAPLIIKADDKVKPQGDPNPALTVSYEGFAYGETQAVLSAQPTLATTATAGSPAGTYSITVSGAAAANYIITYVHGTMTVTPRQPQTISFSALPVKTYGNSDFAAGATSTNNSIPITYTSSNTNVAMIVGGNIRITGAGTTTITASQAGGLLFFPAADVRQQLVVNKANLTVRVADTTKVQGEPNPPFRLIYTGFVSNENEGNLQTAPTVITSATQASSPGYYVLTASGGVSNNYQFIYVDGRLTVIPATGGNEPHLQAFLSSSQTLTVRVFSAEPDLANITLYDATGKAVITKNAFLPKGFINVLISVSNVASGLYSVTVNGSHVKLRKNISIVK